MLQIRPASLYRPAEWARHARTILAWPGSNSSNDGNRPGSLLRATKDVSSIAEAVAIFEPVTLLVSRGRLNEAQTRFASLARPNAIHIQPVVGEDVDLWMRDIAPTFAVKRDAEGKSRSLHGVDFNFNGWGNKFPSKTTAALARTILDDTKIERIASSIVAEGGAIETDGQGTLLVAESSIVNDNRNSDKTRQDIEVELQRTLGVEKIIWVPGIKDVDVTDCHIDAQARFVRPGTVIMSRPNDADTSVWRRVYDETRQALSDATDARGRSLKLVDVSEPDPREMGLDAEMLQLIAESPPALTYVNYLLVNGGLIIPRFGDDEADAAALITFQRLFGEDQKVVQVLLEELPFLGGGIHCASQEVPYTET